MPELARCTVLGLAVMLVAAVGCTDAPLSPAGNPPAATPSTTPKTFTVSGVVLDHTALGVLPLPGLRLNVRLIQPSQATLEVTSDAAGRYSVSGVPAGALTITPAADTRYLAPCPAGTDALKADKSLDVHVASISTLAGAGTTIPLPVGTIWTSGLVLEKTSTGLRRVSGAVVELGEGDSPPTTRTSVSGYYLLCPLIPGTGTDVQAVVRARKEGYAPASRPITLGWDYGDIDIELVPQ